MKSKENVKLVESTRPADSGEALPPLLASKHSRILVYIGLLLLSLFTTGAMVNYMQCQTRGCSPATGTMFNSDLLSPDAVRATTQGEIADLWIEIGDSGVFTPTTSNGHTVLYTDDGQTISYLDDLATKGYIAIRVPHAPPTYTLSSLLPGILPWEPDPVTFSYYSPPTSNDLTTIAVTVTRRADLEAIVNARSPILDGKSHWEVWWLPQGEKFPIPSAPFRLESGSWPPPLGLRYRIDFGSGSNALACAGCEFNVLGNNGYLFIGPYSFALRYGETTVRDPLVSFGPHCGYYEESLAPTILQYITPATPFTHVQCLENWDTSVRTFSIDASSSQGWDYTYYWQGVEFGDTPQPAGDPPFTVDVGPLPNDYEPGALGLLAVYTPTIAITDTLRETFIITATSLVSPGVQASSLSVALAPGYTLNEVTEPPPQRFIYLPVVVRNNP